MPSKWGSPIFVVCETLRQLREQPLLGQSRRILFRGATENGRGIPDPTHQYRLCLWVMARIMN
ncbi:hypothetical protein [Egbenema bharatensis]|uniref:hypothetical protein n=1 Tax=Egbenema bharatensis TaxID=3463334 RepID=UPI003A85BBD0